MTKAGSSQPGNHFPWLRQKVKVLKAIGVWAHRQAQSDASINLAEIRNFLFCALWLLNTGVTLSSMAEAWAAMMVSHPPGSSLRACCRSPTVALIAFIKAKLGCVRAKLLNAWDIIEFIYLSKAITECISQARYECWISLNRVGDLLCMSTITSMATKFMQQSGGDAVI